MERIPKKLKDDPILEGIFEIRFSSSDVPELIVGKLAASKWAAGSAMRLPVANIPQPIRLADPSLSIQPTLQIKCKKEGRIVKVGDKVLSYHVTSPYPGWDVYFAELQEVLSDLFAFDFADFTIERLGFRYINGMKNERHFVSRVDDLSIRISINDSKIDRPVNLNYSAEETSGRKGIVKLASREFISVETGDPPDILIDIDIFTTDGLRIASKDEALKWLDGAHTALKKEFFALFTAKMAEELVEEW